MQNSLKQNQFEKIAEIIKKQMEDTNYLSEDERDEIIESSIKKEVDEKTYWDNWSPGFCGTCILEKNCKKEIGENWDQDCEEWDYILICKKVKEK